MNQIAIYGKNIKEKYLPAFQQLVDGLKSRGYIVLCEENFAAFLHEKYGFVWDSMPFYNKEHGISGEVSMLLSFGGDGTFLDAVEYICNSEVPILGINSGRLGFLANVKVDEISHAVDDIVTGNYQLEQRQMLQLEVDGEKIQGMDYALNEVGVQKMAIASLLKIHAYIGDVFLTTYWADGLVVATPTGSTAYSMSGGGPIVSPECQNIILTPISPHNLSMRPLIVPASAEIRLEVESRSGSFILSTDLHVCKVSDGCKLTVQCHPKKLNVVKLPGHNYYETLRKKLKWGEDERNDKSQE